MEKSRFKIDIDAPAEIVWNVLWQDETLRDWSGIIDPGTYMVGELVEGSTVQFNSAEGYGVTSLVAKLTPSSYVLFRHKADTKEDGDSNRDDQWTGGEESYTLTEKDGKTILEMELDIPSELVQIMSTSYPKALQRVKQLSEAR